MADMTKYKTHLNAIARSIGIRPGCRSQATEEEMAFAAEWMRRRASAVREQAASEPPYTSEVE